MCVARMVYGLFEDKLILFACACLLLRQSSPQLLLPEGASSARSSQWLLARQVDWDHGLEQRYSGLAPFIKFPITTIVSQKLSR